jgi:ubiquinone/menaquinone biosynthesis C-methylase UbiE
MTLIYLGSVLLILLVFGFVLLRNVFLKAQNSGWYPFFLMPVVQAIFADTGNKKILDIGTGPGKLPELLIRHNPQLQITATDIDEAMIDEARKRNNNKNVSFKHQKVGENLGFEDGGFDVVTFCSVLFLLDDKTKSFLLAEALRVLKPGGKIIVLSPSGLKSILTSFTEVWKYPYSSTNWTFIVWKILTTHSAKKWRKSNWLAEFSKTKNHPYNSAISFNNNALIESLTNIINN